MKKHILKIYKLYLSSVLILSMLLLNACVNPLLEYQEIPEETSIEETTAPFNEEFGYGKSFSFIDHTDKGVSLNYTLKKSDDVWYLMINGENALKTGTRIISNYDAQSFFTDLANDSLIINADTYNKKDESIIDGWWFSLDISYDNKIISAYGYMRHMSDYDDIRVKITKELNRLFNLGETVINN